MNHCKLGDSGEASIPDKKKGAHDRGKESMKNVMFEVIQDGHHVLYEVKRVMRDEAGKEGRRVRRL